jgi:hypothetical protein
MSCSSAARWSSGRSVRQPRRRGGRRPQWFVEVEDVEGEDGVAGDLGDDLLWRAVVARQREGEAPGLALEGGQLPQVLERDRDRRGIGGRGGEGVWVGRGARGGGFDVGGWGQIGRRHWRLFWVIVAALGGVGGGENGYGGESGAVAGPERARRRGFRARTGFGSDKTAPGVARDEAGGDQRVGNAQVHPPISARGAGGLRAGPGNGSAQRKVARPSG